MLIPLFQEEIRQSPYTRNGITAYRACSHGLNHCGCEHHHHSHRLNFIVNWFSENIAMAKRSNASSSGFTPTTFVKCDLTSEDKKHVTEFIKKSAASMDDLVIEVLQTNHKISFSFNGQTDSFICSVTGKPEDCNNASKCYTSHAKDYVTALWVALYKFHVIWKRGPWEAVETDSDFG